MSDGPTQDRLDSEEILEHAQSLHDVMLTKQEREGLKQILALELMHKVFAVVFIQNRNTAADLLGMANLSSPEGIAKALRLQGAASGALNVLDTFFDIANNEESATYDPEVTHE